jgi:hypothetical protein
MRAKSRLTIISADGDIFHPIAVISANFPSPVAIYSSFCSREIISSHFRKTAQIEANLAKSFESDKDK